MTYYLKLFSISTTLVAFTGFTSVPSVPLEVERSFIVRRDFDVRKEGLSAADCWNTFLAELKRLDAIVFIPLENQSVATRFGMTFGANTLSNEKSQRVTQSSAEYMSVVPTGRSDDSVSCGKTVAATFNQLGMVVLVKRSQVHDIAQSFTIKVARGEFRIKTAQEVVGSKTKSADKNYEATKQLLIQMSDDHGGMLDGTHKYVPVSALAVTR